MSKEKLTWKTAMSEKDLPRPCKETDGCYLVIPDAFEGSDDRGLFKCVYTGPHDYYLEYCWESSYTWINEDEAHKEGFCGWDNAIDNFPVRYMLLPSQEKAQ